MTTCPKIRGLRLDTLALATRVAVTRPAHILFQWSMVGSFVDLSPLRMRGEPSAIPARLSLEHPVNITAMRHCLSNVHYASESLLLMQVSPTLSPLEHHTESCKLRTRDVAASRAVFVECSGFLRAGFLRSTLSPIELSVRLLPRMGPELAAFVPRSSAEWLETSSPSIILYL